MSLDFHITLKGNKVLDQESLKSRLSKDFEIVSFQDSSNKVVGFNAKSLSNPEQQYEFNLQEDGSYWTYTYDYEESSLIEFLKGLAKIAELLEATLADPQSSEKNIDPDKFVTQKRIGLSKTMMNIRENIIPKVMEKISPGSKRTL